MVQGEASDTMAGKIIRICLSSCEILNLFIYSMVVKRYITLLNSYLAVHDVRHIILSLIFFSYRKRARMEQQLLRYFGDLNSDI